MYRLLLCTLSIFALLCCSVSYAGGIEKPNPEKLQFIVDDYVDWLKSNGVEDFTLVRLRVEEVDGVPHLELAAKDKIIPGQVAISVPAKMVIHEDTIAKTKFGEVLSQSPRIPSRLSLVMFVMSSLLRDGGFWQPYFRMVRYFDGAQSFLNWKPHTYGALDGTAKTIYNMMDESHQNAWSRIVEPFTKEHPKLFPNADYKTFREAAMIVARKEGRYGLGDDVVVEGIVPVLAEMQLSPTANTGINWSEKNGTVFIVAQGTISTGDVITASETRQELGHSLLYHNKLSDDPTTDSISVTLWPALPTKIQQLAKDRGAGPEAFQTVFQSGAIPAQPLSILLRLGVDRLEALKVLKDAISTMRETMFTTNIAGDKRALEVVARAEDFDPDLYRVVECRLREKEVLQSAVEKIEEEIAATEEIDEIDEL